MTSVERRGVAQGQLQVAREMLLEAVATRFEEVPEDVTAAVQRLDARETLHARRQALPWASLEAFRDILHPVPR